MTQQREPTSKELGSFLLAIIAVVISATAVAKLALSHPNTDITPDSLTLIVRNEGCEVWRFRDMGKFHYYARCQDKEIKIVQATSAQEGEPELIETTYRKGKKP